MKWLKTLLLIVSLIHLVKTLRYEHHSAIPITETWAPLQADSSSTCNEQVDSHWLKVMLYVRCYPSPFQGRISRMQDSAK